MQSHQPVPKGPTSLMKKRVQHTPEHIIDTLRHADELKISRHDTVEIDRRANVPTASLLVWHKKYEGMTTQDAKELKALPG